MKCAACAGSGVCDACSGYGYFPISAESDYSGADCLVCDGSCECAECDGTGHTTTTTNISSTDQAATAVLELRQS